MEFAFTPEQEKFRQEVQAFLKRECTKEVVWALNWDPDAEICHRWQRTMARHGFLTLGWPRKYGGQERSLIEQAIFLEEAGASGAFDDTILIATHFGVASALIHFGSEELKGRFLTLIARGEVRFTNALTEPEAGSDLASLKTRAEQVDDSYILNGQKMFITGAHRVNFVHVATRTDPNAPIHRGISMIVVDAKSPGFLARPMTNLLGKRDECQVFLDNVRVPASNMVGEKNRGWYVLMGTLDVLRSGIMSVGSSRRRLEELLGLCRNWPLKGPSPGKDPSIKHKLAQLYIDIETWRMLAWRIVWLQDQGQTSNYETSASFLVSKTVARQLSLIGMEVTGYFGVLRKGSKGAVLEGEVATRFLQNPSLQAGGTYEIQRNIIAQRGLGLPRG